MIDRKLLKLPKMKQVLAVLAGLFVLQAFFIIGQAVSLSQAITHLWSGQLLVNQCYWMILFLVTYTLRHGVKWLQDMLLDRYATEQASALRQQLLIKVFRDGPAIIQKHGTGNMTTLALDGIDNVKNYLKLITEKMMSMSIVPWLVLVTIFWLDWRSGVVLLLVFPLIILFMIILGYAAKNKADKQFASYQKLANHFMDAIRGIDTLKRFGVSQEYGNSIFKTSERFRVATMSTLKVAILSTFALDFFTTLSIAIVAVLLGLRLINGEVFLFEALTVLILSPEYFLPVRDFSGDYHATLDGKNAFQAVTSVLDEPSQVAGTTAIGEWHDTSSLELSGITFSYNTSYDISHNTNHNTGLTTSSSDSSKMALKQIDLAVSGYHKVGIIGMSGSGKSTLINLLSGFLSQQAGEVRLEGQAISSLKEKQWQQQLAYIPQNPYIFSGTLAANMAFYHPAATKEQLLQAAQVVGLNELIAQLPDGIDTKIGEGERALSGGQAQRIALARAFLDPSRKIWLFDEPTAHLDIETEVELKERMVPLMANHLVFFATHRLHWMKQMDHIIVMDQGEIVEQGSLEKLLAKNGAFCQLSTTLRGDQNVKK